MSENCKFAKNSRNTTMKHLIVGGVAGGATAAARIRRITEKDEIILFERGEYISYANCGLPYYIGGTIADRDRLFLQTPEAFGCRFNIDVRTRSEVMFINTDTKTVSVKGPNGKVYSESYDRLLLSPGATPFKPPIPGIDLPGIFTLRNVADTDAVKEYLNQHKVKHAIVIGGGFIGLEMAENLYENGAEVTVVEMADQVMAPIDFSMASIIHQHLVQKGVGLRLSTAVKGFEEKNGTLEVALDSGEKLPADIVILSIGVRPANQLAVGAGIETGKRGGIVVNEYLHTSAPDVYAVGDVIEYPNPITGEPWMNYLAGPANRQARIVADNMVFGDKVKYEGAIGTSIAKVFDYTVAATGMAAKRLKADGIPYLTATIHPNSHAGYYPGAIPMTIKVVFSPENGKLLGAQIVGYDGVDKRIDMLAQVIKRGGCVTDLIETEHAYAPPYSSAKDPVALAGYVSENILTGRMKPIYWRELRDADPNTITLIDVRTAEEFATGALPGAINFPLDELRSQLDSIPHDKPIILYCGVGLRGYLASTILEYNGFKNVRNLIGGLKTYLTATDELSTPMVKHAETNGSETCAESKTICIDACGLSCPGPIMKMRQAVEAAPEGAIIDVKSTDPGFPRDAEAWCQSTGNRFLSQQSAKGVVSVAIEKCKSGNTESKTVPTVGENGKSFILFSDDLDKALATFVLANGAVATGGKVTIFFTFWGLNAIKKQHKPKVKKDIFGRMFGMMLSSDSLHLKLSKMNMFGMGPKMMRYIMKRKNIESLETLRQSAIDNGVEFIACQMSMDVMGVKKEELLDNVTIGGVATYMNRAEQSRVNLFI